MIATTEKTADKTAKKNRKSPTSLPSMVAELVDLLAEATAEEVMNIEEVMKFLQIGKCKAELWMKDLVAYGFKPLANMRQFRCFKANLIEALKAQAAEAVNAPD
mgnify:CR=1 FL=1